MQEASVSALRNIAKAIQLLDVCPSWVSVLGSHENITRADEARARLVNIIFSNGYELKQGGGIVKSKTPRILVKE